MATTKQLLSKVLQDGDTLADLVCIWQPHDDDHDRWSDPPVPNVQTDGEALPEREFDDGYGGARGEPCIAFSERYVYIRGVYDGAEWFEAIPRHPQYVGTELPLVGGQ